MTGLLATSLFWLAVTLGVFEAADTVSKRSGRHPLCHPVLWSTPVLIGLLLWTGTPYATYRDATFPLSFLLGPAVVGLAVPIWAERARIRRLAIPIALALTAGAVTSIVSAVGILSLFGAPREVLASIAPRAATTPVAMAVASQLGGIPALAAVIVLFAGVFGAMCATPLLNLLKVRDYRARGFAVGVAAHGIGSARAFQVDPTAGALASLGMALNAVMTAALLSLLAIFL
ncbi:LrgB family protein [Novosphingobium mangrovi (ex Huang et al. 2023)]|uniref:LrgB family protein n=1 Tax=Novosphingobium mangrovi (ex Huang et al. 2023) TaxID=2976432 RepID=A0ABT2I9V9_9SPHN|nr:LrgB family protein [Novosphingobium mangrovi (ex Huang et al. 2023)]MCT2401591.1 LrgB family protein [Novosphingobium mangrovi (ex Huang et al. 2023)]